MIPSFGFKWHSPVDTMYFIDGCIDRSELVILDCDFYHVNGIVKRSIIGTSIDSFNKYYVERVIRRNRKVVHTYYMDMGYLDHFVNPSSKYCPRNVKASSVFRMNIWGNMPVYSNPRLRHMSSFERNLDLDLPDANELKGECLLFSEASFAFEYEEDFVYLKLTCG